MICNVPGTSLFRPSFWLLTSCHSVRDEFTDEENAKKKKRVGCINRGKMVFMHHGVKLLLRAHCSWQYGVTLEIPSISDDLVADC